MHNMSSLHKLFSISWRWIREQMTDDDDNVDDGDEASPSTTKSTTKMKTKMIMIIAAFS